MDNLVITIGRQYGSGGLKIARMLADKMGIKCYDKELLAVAAEDSGFCEEILKQHDEKPSNSFLYSMVMDPYYMGGANTFMDMPLNQKVFLAQFDAIKKLAQHESCVIVGRCADYALEEHDNKISIFITADIEDCIDFSINELGDEPAKAKDIITKTNKKRASYYNYYTNKKWGSAESYDLCINRSRTGFEGAVEAILSYIDIVKNLKA